MIGYIWFKIIKKWFDYEFESIPNIILSEISLFLVSSLFYLSFIFINDCRCSCACNNLKTNINDIVLNDENDDEKSVEFKVENEIFKEKTKKLFN